MKKFLLSLLSTLLSLSLLSGCGSAEPAPPAAFTPVPMEDVVLRYWSMWEADEPQAKAITTAAEAFYRETGIRVNIDFMGQGDEAKAQLKQALADGEDIDVFDHKMETLTQEFTPWLASLGQLTMQYEYSRTASPELIRAARETGNGDLLFIPYQPYAMVFFYNRDIFHLAGVEEPPATWEEFLEVCQKVKTAGYIPLACDDAFMDLLIGYHVGRITGESGLEDLIARRQWDHPAMRQMARDYAVLARRGYFSPTVETNQWPYSQNEELATGKAAMYFTGSWLPHDLIPLTGEDFPWGAFSYPSLPNERFGQEALNYSAMGLAVNKSSPHTEESFRFIQFLTKGTFDSMLSQVTHSIPVDQDNSCWPKQLADLRPILREVSFHWTWGAGVDCDPEVSPILVRNFQKLCAGLYTDEEFIAAMLAEAPPPVK